MTQIDKKALLDKIAEKIRKCQKCPLYKTRINPVPGEGNPNACIMFIGEAPGYHEDRQGRPFVGAAGKLLTEMIEEILGLRREDVFITNVVKCRPPKNRDPTPEEIKACAPFLDEQIEVIRPNILVCLGRYSSRYILSKLGVRFKSILSIRGKTFTMRIGDRDILVIPTIHPAAALYKRGWENFLRDDFKKVKQLCESLKESNKKKTSILDYF